MSEETEIVEQAENAEVGISPKQVEEMLLEQAQARAEDPTETASTVYQMYLPHFERALPKLSTRGLRRVINFLVKYPLHQEDIKSANDFERDFMHLTNGLVEAKYVMIMDTYRQHAEKLYEAANTPLTTEEEAAIQAEIEEKTNG